jgi:hypothetical protein
LAQHDLSKPVAVLLAVLDAKPAGLGFVLPSAFILERQYLKVRQRLEEEFGTIEVVEIPDDVFQASRTAAALVIARDRRPVDAERRVALRSSEVTLRDRLPFLRAGVITRSREEERWVSDPPTGALWVPALQDLWTYLASHPRLDSLVELHRGVEWNIDQRKTWSEAAAPGFRPGLHSARGRVQYDEQSPVWLDCLPEHTRGGALALDWAAPKILLNAARLSRYQWRLAASLDQDGLVASQQFVGVWAKAAMGTPGLLEIVAVLNGPVANAFATVFSSGKGFRLGTLGRIPLPRTFAPELASLVQAYLADLESPEFLARDARLSDMLAAVDAALLQSYDLPTRLERQLLAYFHGARRPTAHEWTGWGDLVGAAGLSLSEIRSGRAARHGGNWVAQVFQALPADEAEELQAWAG